MKKDVVFIGFNFSLMGVAAHLELFNSIIATGGPTSIFLGLIREYWFLLFSFGFMIAVYGVIQSEHRRYRRYSYTPSSYIAESKEIELPQPKIVEILEIPRIETEPALMVLQCPNCAAPLNFREGSDLTTCSHCKKQILLSSKEQR